MKFVSLSLIGLTLLSSGCTNVKETVLPQEEAKSGAMENETLNRNLYEKKSIEEIQFGPYDRPMVPIGGTIE